ncbi:hypothetical protein NDN08_007465 [Rhodosorus marinus]|uniref:Programmed cell death protein 5 n=1 Tax=Rhodosorus marinus TaxID=101924 RepID=A0AAV8V0H3_9RHOD|nr:hypothetical protein NDN08_007465 [Rhodosorus marinus]
MSENGMNVWEKRAMKRAQEGQSGLPPGGAPAPGQMDGAGGGPSAEEKAAQQRAQEEQRRIFLKQILTPQAAERLANIALVKPDKARQLENYLLSAAQTGRLGGQVSEEQLKSMLSQFTEAERKPKVTVSRRRTNFDDDDDDEDDW